MSVQYFHVCARVRKYDGTWSYMVHGDPASIGNPYYGLIWLSNSKNEGWLYSIGWESSDNLLFEHYFAWQKKWSSYYCMVIILLIAILLMSIPPDNELEPLLGRKTKFMQVAGVLSVTVRTSPKQHGISKVRTQKYSISMHNFIYRICACPCRHSHLEPPGIRHISRNVYVSQYRHACK